MRRHTVTAPAGWDTLALATDGTGSITQTARGTLHVTNLAASAGTVALTDPDNQVTQVAGRTVGEPFSFTSANSLTVGTVGGVTGIATGAPGGGAAVTLLTPILVVDQAIDTGPGSGGLLATGSGVTLHDAPTLGAGNIILNHPAAPTVTLTAVGPDPAPLTPLLVTVTFSNPVSGFTADDFTVTNGTVSQLAGNGAFYTLVVTPLMPGRVTLAVAAGAATDALRQGNTPGEFSRLFESPQERYVTQLYHQLLNRDVDSGGLSFWSQALTKNHPRAEIVDSIMRSGEYHELQVRQLYQDLLLRDADAGGLAFHTAFLTAGGSLEDLTAQILGSHEYLQRHGGNAAGFDAALAHDVLFREIDPTLSAFLDGVNKSGASHEQAARMLLASVEARKAVVGNSYQAVLGRAPDTGGLTYFVGRLANGAQDNDVLAKLVESDEYFSRS